MVNPDGSFEKTDELVTTSFRLPKDLKRRVEEAAKMSRRSFNAELLFRLMGSFGLDPTPIMPTAPLASDTAIRALAKTEEHAQLFEGHAKRFDAHAARLDEHEVRLRKLETR